MAARFENWSAWFKGSTLHVTGDLDAGNTSDAAILGFDSLLKSKPPVLVLKVIPTNILAPRRPGDHKVKLHFEGTFDPNEVAGIQIVSEKGELVSLSSFQTAY